MWRRVFEAMAGSIGQEFAVLRPARNAAGKPVDWVIEEVDPACPMAFGIPRDKAVGHALRDLGSSAVGLVPLFTRVLETGTPATARWHDIHRDRPVQVSAARLDADHIGAMAIEIDGDAGESPPARQAEPQFEIALEAGRMGTWTWDLATDTIHLGHRARAMLGFSPDAPDRVSFAETLARVHPDDVGRVREQVERAMTGSGGYETEYRVTAHEGEPHWLSTRGQVQFEVDAAGVRRPIRISGVVADVTERKETEAALLRSEAHARRRLAEIEAIYHSAPIGLCVLDTGMRWVRINRLLAEINGIPPEEHVGRTPREVIPDIADQAEAALRQVLETGEPILDLEVRGMTPAMPGVVRSWNEQLVPLKDEDGRIVGVSIAAEETTLRRQAERELRRSRELLAEAQRIAHVGTFVLDLDTGELEWSEEAYRLFDVDPGPAPILDVVYSRIVPEDRDAVRATLEENRRGAGPPIVRYRVARRDGSVITIERRCHPEESDGRKRLVGTLQDVTENVAAERQRRELEQRVLQAEKLESLQVLAGGVAHDFNNLLTGVIGNADLALLDATEGSSLRALIEDIRTAAVRAAELAAQMLAYSGRGRFILRAIDINEAIRDTLALVRASVPKGVRLDADLAPRVPPVEADLAQVRQIVMNLVTNSAEAIGEGRGGILIRTSVTEVESTRWIEAPDGRPLPAGSYVVVEVTDTGAGMDPETQARIFEPFFSTKFTGRGLGLAAVLGIIRGHRGAIEVESHPGQGTTIRVFLPVSGRLARPAAPVAATGPLVLVVDDEQIVRETMRRMLERKGFRVVTAEDGQAGVRALTDRGREVRAVVLDVTMPNMGGREALGEMRRIRPDLPVLVTSGYSEEEVLRRFGSDRGAIAGFIPKPFDFGDLVRKLGTICDRRAGPPRDPTDH